MGTVFSIDIRPPLVSRDLINQVIAWLHEVDATFSTWRPDSPVSRLARGEIDLTDCSPEVRQILARCADLERATAGYFSAYATGQLDPSGLVKGWAIEQASHQLVAGGSANHCVNGGGDVQCAGQSRPGQPWRVGIAHPLRAGATIAVLVGVPLTVATSGSAERGGHITNPVTGRPADQQVGEGLAVATSGSAERGAHITNPHTGRPAAELASVTVAGPSLALADAYATAAYAMGREAYDWLDALADYDSFVVGLDGLTWQSRRLATGGANGVK
jgi:thiamine biosynthesis lipoprotein